jgi:hypothetical protein
MTTVVPVLATLMSSSITAAVGRVEIARGFVGQDHLRCRHQRTRHRNTLLLAAGELLRRWRARCAMRLLQRRPHAPPLYQALR